MYWEHLVVMQQHFKEPGSDSYKNDFTIRQRTTALSIKEINISNDGKLLITTNEAITDANTLDIV